MIELVFMIGPSGSGKSTWLKKQSGYEIVSPDDIRRELTGDVSDQSVSRQAWKNAALRTIMYLSNGKSVVLDAINVVSGSRGKFLKQIRELFKNFTTKAVVIGKDVSTDELYKRVSKDIEDGVDRSNVPYDVIKRQVENFKNGEQNLVDQFDEVVYV